MTFKIPGVKWKKVALDEAVEAYDIERVSKDISLDDLFPDEPEHFYVHKGDVTVAGKLGLFAEPDSPEPTVYVIDGDLTVEGPFAIENLDAYTPLFVTGTLKAKSAAVTWDACLIVGKSLIVEDVLFTYLTDAGNLVTKGTSARLWLEAGGRGNFSGKKSAETKRLVNPDDDEKKNPVVAALLPAFVDDGDCDPEKIREAILKGKPIVAG